MKILMATLFTLFSSTLLALTPVGNQIQEGLIWNLPLPEKMSLTIKHKYSLDTTCKLLGLQAETVRKYNRPIHIERYDKTRLTSKYLGRDQVFGIFFAVVKTSGGRVDFIHEDKSLTGQDDLLSKKSSRSSLSLMIGDLYQEKLSISYDKDSLTEFSISHGLEVPLPQVDYHFRSQELIITTSSMDTACDLIAGKMKIDIPLITGLFPTDEHIDELLNFYDGKVLSEIHKINKKYTKPKVRAAHFGRQTGMIIEREFPRYTKKEVASFIIQILKDFYTEKMDIKPELTFGISSLIDPGVVKIPLEIKVEAP